MSKNNSIKKEIKQLESKLKTDKSQDLIKFKQEIKPILEEEIVKRYFYPEGKIEFNLRYDESIKKSEEILGEIKKYNDISSNSSLD